MVSPLNALGSAIGDGFNHLGDAFNSVGSSIGGWFTTLDSHLSGWADTQLKSTGSWFTSLNNNLSTWADSLLNWFNPLSKSFFLWVAFIPSDGFFSKYSSDWSGLMHTKFAIIYQLHDTFTALVSAVKSNLSTWQGIQIDLSNYKAGKVDIVNGYAIEQYGEKIRYWIGGLMFFFTGTWLFRRISSLLGVGR